MPALTLKNRLDYYRRILATGFCFTVFGLGSVLAWLLVFPLNALPISKAQRQRTGRRIVGKLFQGFMHLLRFTRPLIITVEGAEKLQTPGSKLVVANHPTLLDVVVLLSLLPDAVCIVKADFERSPLYRSLLRATGYLSNADPERLLEGCQQALKNGTPVLLFPEGTRSVPGRPLKFLRGAAQIALRSQHDVTPVVITSSPPTLLKNQKWYDIPTEGPARIHFRIQDPLPVAEYIRPDEGIPLASRKFNRHLTDFFRRHLDC